MYTPVHTCTSLVDARRTLVESVQGGVYRPQYQGDTHNILLPFASSCIAISTLHLTPLAPCATFRPWAYRPQGATTWTTGTIPQSPACNSPNINGRASADIESSREVARSPTIPSISEPTLAGGAH